MLTATLSLVPLDGVYSADVQVSLTSTTLQLVINSATCNGGTHCLAVDRASSTGGEIHLNGQVYVGNVPDMTPYLRSKLKTLQGFAGCLGV